MISGSRKEKACSIVSSNWQSIVSVLPSLPMPFPWQALAIHNSVTSTKMLLHKIQECCYFSLSLRVLERLHFKRLGCILTGIYGHGRDIWGSMRISRLSWSEGKDLHWKTLIKFKWSPWITMRSQKDVTRAFLYVGFDDAMTLKTQSLSVSHITKTRRALFRLSPYPRQKLRYLDIHWL